MRTIECYTDGGCAPTNPGPGACAYVITEKNVLLRSEVFRLADATNNIMEMTAMIKCMEACIERYKTDNIYIFTDSQYVQQGLTKWISRWKENNWKNASGKPVSNKDLWLKLDSLMSELNVTVQWVRGHNGNVWNELCDQLCSKKVV